MPLFKGKSSKAKPQKAIDYVTNPQKAVVVTSQALDDNRSYAKQFKETCDMYGKGSKLDERKYYHFKLSCNPADNPTPQQSHELAQMLAQQLFPDHECVIATHDDTETLHSHIIVNAVSFETGKKLHLNDKAYRDCKDLANTLGAEMGLSTLDWRTKTKEKRERSKSGEAITSEGKYLSSAERNMAKNKELGTASWKEALRHAIDEAKAHTTSRVEFQRYLQEHLGVTMPRNTAKTVTFIHPGVGETYAIRGNKLGADYTATAIDETLLQNKNYNDRRVLDEGLFTTTQHYGTEYHATGASYTEPPTGSYPIATTATAPTSNFTPSPTPQPHDWTIPSERNVQEGSRKRTSPRSISDISAELGSIDDEVGRIAGRVQPQILEPHIGDDEAICDVRAEHEGVHGANNIAISEPQPEQPKTVARPTEHEPSVQPKPRQRSTGRSR